MKCDLRWWLMTRRVSSSRARRVCIVVAAALLLLAPNPLRVMATGFQPPCSLPFDSLKAKHPIDDGCGPEGTATSEAQKEQNRVKNEFCASGTLVRITYVSFERLQQKVDQLGIPYGSSNNLPPDRSAL